MAGILRINMSTLTARVEDLRNHTRGWAEEV